MFGMTFDISEAMRAIQQASEREVACHAESLECLRGIRAQTALIWLPRTWAMAPERTVLWEHLLSGRFRRRLRALLHHPATGCRVRAHDAVTERFAVMAGVWQLFGECQKNPLFTPATLFLSHTSLGQPLVRWRAPLATWANARGLQARNLHVSFSHDGDAHLALLAHAPGLRGLGLDVVHLPRLRRHGKDSAYLRRLARHFMGEEEYVAFTHESQRNGPEALLRRVAAHFSLMEAASKALGTGLRMGGGMGRSTSLPKQSLGVLGTTPPISFVLGSEARARCRKLGAGTLEGHWSAEDEYLVSTVLLWK
ncbi:MAG TPA: 4'-phosphopantetheinyl transferase superfamily protein [Chthonomonadales bacterium]|nr:4'-phosphopantetheinyl transferase superfamily protein [Chthonomonadales bacterium]